LSGERRGFCRRENSHKKGELINMKKLKMMLFAPALFLLAFALTASAQDTMMKSKSNGKAAPTVALIRADWCSACKQVEPIIQDLMQSYGGKFNLVVFDVTNEETTAQAIAKAKSLGLSGFFEANKKSTSTVGIFKSKRQIFKTTHNPDRNAYVNAFNKALK
jgi:thiol-disulfide isomerase/thioredoxin